MRRGASLAAMAMLALGTQGCIVEPRPAVEASIPPSWPAGDAYLRQSEAALPALGWREIFGDARLQALLTQALANNRDLRVTAANIAAARANARIREAARLPQIDSVRSASHVETDTGGSDRVVAELGITNFEIDLFGRLAALSRAAQARYLGTETAARATRLALVGDIANVWLSYGADASLLKIAQETVASAEKSVALTGARLRGGVAPRSDLRQAEQILATAQADIARQQTALAQDINALQLLVGAPIDPALLPDSIDNAAPTIAELPAGLDSGILLRRPDVVQAEYELDATNEEVAAARAALFPRLSLTATAGFASNSLSSLFTDGAFNWSVVSPTTYPIFRAGAGRASVRLSKAQRDAALARYEKAIQTAFREVADALARRGTINEQLTAVRLQESAAADAAFLADARYQGGVANYLGALDAQRAAYAAHRARVASQLAQAANLVDLYRRLGGDPQF